MRLAGVVVDNCTGCRGIEVGRAEDALEIGVAQEIISGVLPYVTGVYILVGSTCR